MGSWREWRRERCWVTHPLSGLLLVHRSVTVGKVAAGLKTDPPLPETSDLPEGCEVLSQPAGS